MSWYAPKSIADKAKKSFPQCLAEFPVLLPTDDASNRIKINQWFEKNNLNPNLVGEFEDSALLATFGASGLGIFPAAELLQNDLSRYYEVEKIGYCDDVVESFFGIYTEKKAQHPLVKTILASHPR
jgi:LysR family transcriptional activator of nhaA